MRFSLRLQMNFKNVKITYRSELRFLEIYIMENLTWGTHAQSLGTKLCKVIHMMKILKDTMSSHMIRKIYYSNFHSYLRYDIILWGGDSESNKFFNCKRRSFE
jgi:hypothetical protein